MATPSNAPENHEPPSQGIFMGYLALALILFVLAIAGLGLYAGSLNGFTAA